MSSLLLTSGGSDSLLLTKMLQLQGHSFEALFVNYGQLAVDREWASCVTHFDDWGLPHPIRMDLPGFGAVVRSGLTDSSLDIFDDAFLPCRNLLMLVLAGSVAYQRGHDNIIMGLIDESAQLFPDQGSDFLAAAEDAIQKALGYHITISTPLLDVDKRTIISLCKELGIAKTYYCHAGKAKPCGKCVSCKERQSAAKSSA